ncbi:Deoxyuridine 5'-triphosphate nucleotidohydrolase [Patulibacter medicamentivorans]|uniref:Deoxyuridine 5'-triphosphate nucleotidohydrolase n=1 Tax=Patulibacter medicamentivorans TaxID=1097667 RepID=H0E2S9_9ACTN|nr:dUTP diphosphatase [Patulibacter medicamentivorans]EHN12007.1 Deoxyuridine 5'-triphosphate nucleotidohydrolase [Patulibacter medicamentivorans]
MSESSGVSTIAFRRLDPAAVIPLRQHPGDAGLDLCCLEPIHLEPGDRAMVPTGLAVAIPEGHVGLVVPRSGLAARHGISLVNAPGTIDAGYRGELRVLLLNSDREQPFIASSGERIAQLLVLPVALPVAVEVDELGETARGDGGFGSTGR